MEIEDSTRALRSEEKEEIFSSVSLKSDGHSDTLEGTEPLDDDIHLLHPGAKATRVEKDESFAPLTGAAKRSTASVLKTVALVTVGVLGLAGVVVLCVLLLQRQQSEGGAEGGAEGGVEQQQPQPVYLEKCFPLKVEVPQVSDLSLAEKVGQMTQIDQRGLKTGDEVTQYLLGSLLSGGGGGPKWGDSAADWAAMVDHFQAKAQKTRLKIPLLYGADAVHGHNNVKDATIFPHHVGMGAARNETLMRAVAAAVAVEVYATGVRWSFSPAIPVCQDPRWGRCYESFSEVPEVVSFLGAAAIEGWQSFPDTHPPSFDAVLPIFIAATAKHFVGDGGTKGGKDQGDTDVSEAELREVHLEPYLSAVEKQVATVMASYSSWKGQKMHGDKYLLSDVLRGELMFEGVVVSDWAAIDQLNGTFNQQVRDSINAGIDMVMVPWEFDNFTKTLTHEIETGGIPMERIDEAVGRILLLKLNLGLFDNPCAKREFLKEVGSSEHRALAREAVRQSLVLLKNQQREAESPLFPLDYEGKKILVAGQHGNDIGLQSGGWTITWQGGKGNITKGTTILEGILEVVGTDAQVAYSDKPSQDEVADLGIIVVGEKPYAEMKGDNALLEIDEDQFDLVITVCDQMPCVVVLITGRPLHIKPILPFIDALVVAWLPGSEGGGVADVLFGDYDFVGKTPFTWFREVKDLPMAYRRSTAYDPLFEFDFGLRKSGERV